MLIDSHTHLSDRQFNGDREEVIARCRAEGMRAIVEIGALSKESGNEPAIRLAENNDFIFATVGVHPHDADICTDATFERVLNWAISSEKVVAIGETGLDYHYNFSTPDNQRYAYRRFIDIARALKKPLVIHDREAHEESLQILLEEKGHEVGGVYHCFSGDWKFARKVLDAGFYLAFGGVVTFRNAADLHEVARRAPLDRMVLETDAPYLAPIPHRGKRNEPWMTKFTAARIAELRGVAVEKIIQATGENSVKLYNLPL